MVRQYFFCHYKLAVERGGCRCLELIPNLGYLLILLLLAIPFRESSQQGSYCSLDLRLDYSEPTDTYILHRVFQVIFHHRKLPVALRIEKGFVYEELHHRGSNDL